ncbi:hypothetical protein [Desertivirga brevis]|uniref:hypothetical protein n=1 Tax=Desertivirga brevis TaxID=2810310 RepID=UPI001A9777F4|nr:hypothetical protein [Pedobacter sp. SYSU D00873]
MKYSFETIKGNLLLFFVILLVPTLFFSILIISFDRSLKSELPEFMRESFVFPMAVSVLTAIIIALAKKNLFWRKMAIEIDLESKQITINGEANFFNDLEYFEFRPGSAITTGMSRSVLFLKFKKRETVMIMPCKSSDRIGDYDRFVKDFNEILASLQLHPRNKTISKAGKVVISIICLIAIAACIFLGIDKGAKAVARVLPSVMVLIAICGVYLSYKSPANTNQANGK